MPLWGKNRVLGQSEFIALDRVLMPDILRILVVYCMRSVRTDPFNKKQVLRIKY